MRVIRYDQQSLEDCVRLIMNIETQFDASLCDLHEQIGRLANISGSKSSPALLSVTEDLFRCSRLIIEKMDDFASLRKGLLCAIDIFNENELKIMREFGESTEEKAFEAEMNAETYVFNQANYRNVTALVDSLFLAVQGVSNLSSNDVDSNAAPFEWLSSDFNVCGVTALEGVKHVAVASIVPRLNTVGSYYDVIAPEWMM